VTSTHPLVIGEAVDGERQDRCRQTAQNPPQMARDVTAMRPEALQK